MRQNKYCYCNFTVLNDYKMQELPDAEYVLIYPDLYKNEVEFSNGYVEMHISHSSHEAPRNVETAIILAKQGFKVRLLPVRNVPGVKNPDAYLIDEDIVIEFKHNYTPTASAIEREVRNAKKQANHLLIHVMSSITKEELIKGLRQHLHRAKNIATIWLLFGEVTYQFLPEEIRSKHIEDKIQ